MSIAVDGFVSQLDDYKLLITKARENLKKRETRKFKRLSQEVMASNNDDDDEEEAQFTINVDPMSGASKFKRKELSEKPIGIDELVSLTPKLSRSASVSVNTSQVNREVETKMTSTFSTHPGNAGKLHPVLPRFAVRSPKKQRHIPSKSDLVDMRKKNPTAIKNAIYCIVILEEFVKELAAVSIEQTLL